MVLFFTPSCDREWRCLWIVVGYNRFVISYCISALFFPFPATRRSRGCIVSTRWWRVSFAAKNDLNQDPDLALALNIIPVQCIVSVPICNSWKLKFKCFFFPPLYLSSRLSIVCNFSSSLFLYSRTIHSTSPFLFTAFQLSPDRRLENVFNYKLNL